MYETNLLTCLQSSCYVENGKINMHTHLADHVIKEQLTEINHPLSDTSFASYIHTSLFLAPSLKLLLTILAANTCVTEKPMSSSNLMWHINEEANNTAMKTSINQHHEAMIVANVKAKGNSKNSKGRSKSREKKKDNHCRNCDKNTHTNDQCFENGGGMARKAPGGLKTTRVRERIR